MNFYCFYHGEADGALGFCLDVLYDAVRIHHEPIEDEL